MMDSKLFGLLAFVGFVSAFNADVRPDASSRWVGTSIDFHKS